MTTAKKLPSGSWRCQVYSHTEETMQPDDTIKKKRIYKSFTSDIPGSKGKRLAEQAASVWAAEKESTSDVQNITFGEALDKYIEGREAVLSPRTIMDYKRTRKKELQSIMNIKIALITQEDIQKAINIEAQNHSSKMVRNSHGLISAVMHVYRPDFVSDKWRGMKGRIVRLTPDSITNRFNRLLKRNGIPHFRFHDLRHYSASIQHALGIPDSYIMQRGGWGNDGTLKAVYRHVLEEQAKQMDHMANNYFSELYNTKCNTSKNPLVFRGFFKRRRPDLNR